MRYALVFISAILAIFSCSKSIQKNDKVASLVSSIDAYSEEKFPINVSDIKVVRERIFLADQGLGQLVSTDHQLSDVNIIGNIGYGPNEMLQPSLLIPSKKEDYVLIYDKERYKFLEYSLNTGSLTDYSKFDFLLMNQEVLFDKPKIVFTSPSEMDKDIISYDLLQNEVLSSYQTESFSKAFFGRYLFQKESQYISVSPYDQLVIETFDSDWKLMGKTDLGELRIIKDLLKPRDQKSPQVSGSAALKSKSQSTLSDAILSDGLLYLLVYEVNKDGIKGAHTVLVLEQDANSWSEINRLRLSEENSYLSFSVFDKGKRIVAFNRSAGSIDVFEISN